MTAVWKDFLAAWDADDIDALRVAYESIKWERQVCEAVNRANEILIEQNRELRAKLLIAGVAP